jgi:uncharacterized protein
VALGLVGAGLVGGAVALSNPVMVLGLAMPAAFFYGIGYGCGRSRAMLYVVGGIALAVAGLVALAFTLGAERFWWGFLWALGIGGVLVFSTVIVLCMRRAGSAGCWALWCACWSCWAWSATCTTSASPGRCPPRTGCRW